MIRLVRNLDLFKQVERSRKLGNSYSQLRSEFGISKSTLSSWFSKTKWSSEIKTRLVVKNRQQSRLHIIFLNKIRLEHKIIRDEKYRQEARAMYEENKDNPLFIMGVSLYWGEGEKVNKGRVSIINTDPGLLQVEINFFRKILKIPEPKLRAAVFIYSDIDENTALDYWSSEIRLPRSQFIKTQILPSRSRLTKRKITNGICNIYFSSVEYSIKMKEWIKLLANEMRL